MNVNSDSPMRFVFLTRLVLTAALAAGCFDVDKYSHVAPGARSDAVPVARDDATFADAGDGKQPDAQLGDAPGSDDVQSELPPLEPAPAQTPVECRAGSTRCSSETGLQACNDSGQWHDTENCSFACVEGACTGVCARGRSRSCGECGDGTQTCTNPSTGEYSSCTGASARSRYFSDTDRDGFGDPAAPVDSCGGPPNGTVANSDDCCDRDARAFPGETTYYPQVTACGGYDYDCSGAAELASGALSTCDQFIPPCFGFASGWRTPVPNCGQPGNFVTNQDSEPFELCLPTLLVCLDFQAQDTQPSVQGCK